jgi:arylsulfatase A-like enzyme
MESRPNILFILVDDLDLLLGTINHMPHLQIEIINNGASFENTFITTPICCPSRVSLLKGQFAHNHQIYTNNPPSGGFPKFAMLQTENSTLATWLQQAGYHTALLGKYLNAYPMIENREYIPPGWNDWYVPVKGKPYTGLNYTLNINGEHVDYSDQPEDYITDVITQQAIDIIERESLNPDPFFIELSFFAPHEPYTPASRHQNLFQELQAPRTPSFNEEDVSDKPGRIRFDPVLNGREIGEIDNIYRQRVRAMQSVDEAILALIEVLTNTGQLENTYIIFTSDNGFHLGQHRDLEGKGSPYEEDIRVPFFIVGPDVPKNKKSEILISNVDFAPTIAHLAGIAPPTYVDGTSFAHILRSSTRAIGADWREAILIEFYGFSSDLEVVPPSYLALRTSKYLYVEYLESNFRELYDLSLDPFQLNNIASNNNEDLMEYLSNWLSLLAECVGDECFSAEKAPPN